MTAVALQQTAQRSHLVYVVDYDVAIARLVSVNLAARGYRVKQFHSGNDALTCLHREHPDLIVLDLLMPDSDGMETARVIRQSSQVPILVLSVRDETVAKLAALDLGADDYITKPFRVDDLLARVRAILRRTAPAESTPKLPHYSYRSGELVVDLEGMRVTSHQRPVQPDTEGVVHLTSLGQVRGPGSLIPSASTRSMGG